MSAPASKPAVHLEWLDSIPNHWEERTIGRDVWVRARLGWRGLTASEYVDEGVPMLATPDIKTRDIDYSAANKITVERYDESPEIQLASGDVLLTKDGSTIGTVNVVRSLPGPATVNGSIAVLTPSSRVDGRYLYWYIASHLAQSNFDRLRGGMGVPHLFQRDINRIRYPAPPLLEQRAIADYLDRETAQIDTLIDEQRRLLSLQLERRTAAIERFVTLGTDREASLTPTSLAWAPLVPAHWTVANIRHFATMKTGHTPSRSVPEYWVDCSIPWFTLADVWQLRSGRQTHLAETTHQINEAGLANSSAELLPPNTVVLSRTASVGYSGIMPRAMATSQDFWNWIPGPDLEAEYLLWVFRAMRREFDRLMIGSTHRTIYQGDAAAIRIPIPPRTEQIDIVERLRREVAGIDRLVAETETLIELQTERRAALITAAVTGQIDVGTAA